MLDYSGTRKSVRSLMYRGEGVHSHSHNTEGDQYKFLGVLESVRQEERLSLDCAAKEFLRRMSVILSSPLSDHNSFKPICITSVRLPNVDTTMACAKLKRLDREACKIAVENGGKHPSGSTAILYMPREKGSKGLRSIEEE